MFSPNGSAQTYWKWLVHPGRGQCGKDCERTGDDLPLDEPPQRPDAEGRVIGLVHDKVAGLVLELDLKAADAPERNAQKRPAVAGRHNITPKHRAGRGLARV